MKQFTTIKTGYTAGVYGCSGEYFTTIYTNGSKNGSFRFYGMYGAEERIAQAMKQKGYKEFYVGSFYGRMTRNDIPNKAYKSENQAIEYIKRGFKQSKEEIEKDRKDHEKIMKQINA
jgi:hypothetical protein